MQFETKQRRKLSARKEAGEINRLRRAYERKLESRLTRLFARQFTEFSNLYESTGEVPPMNSLGEQLTPILMSHYRELLTVFGKRVLDNLEIKFDFDGLVQRYVTERGSRNIVAIDSYTRERVRRAIAAGLKEGESNRDIAKRIQAEGQEFSKRRSAVIARTETHNASSWANHEMHKEFMGPTTVKQWVSTSDNRTRSHHAAMNGKQVGIDEEFTVMTNGVPVQMRYAGDYKGGAANVINCRCTIIYIGQDDEVVEPIEDNVRVSEEPWVFREGIKPNWEAGRMKYGVFNMNFREGADLLDTDVVDSAMFRAGGNWDDATRGRKRLGLSAIDAAFPFYYTTGAYSGINDFFRSWFKGKKTVHRTDGYDRGIEITDELKAEALGYRQKVKETFEKLEPYKGEVHRGVSNRVEKVMAEMEIDQVGSIVRSESFWSTSYEKGASFSKRLTFVIRSKTGRKIDDISNYDNEKEVLFLPGVEFRVTRIERLDGRDDGRTIVYMEEVGDELKQEDINPVLIGGDKVITYSRRFLAKMHSQEDTISVNGRLIDL